MKRPRATPLALVACSLALASALASAPSRARDARRVQRVVIGRGSALAGCEGIDASNDNRTRTTFPAAPRLAFRTRLAGGIGQAPASDTHGNLIVVHSEPRLSKLDESGRLLWSERLASEASSAPVLTSAGKILVVTRDGEAQLYSPLGKLLAKRTLSLADPRRRSLAIPTESGGAAVASGSDLVELDERAAPVRQLHANGNLSTIAETDAGLLAISDNGSVQLARATGALELIGSFEGSVPEGAAVAFGQVFAVVDGHRWAALDLATGHVSTLANEPSLTLSGPVALLEAPAAALVAAGGFVSTRARDGSELSRVALNASGQAFDPALRGLRPALVISDQRGTLAATQSGNDALLVPAGGTALRLEETNCLDPFRPTPLPKGIVFACRSGQLFGFSDTAP
ncbi:MAG TPA: PQQ-binding-like beta-propeller repeat protein [Polyangiaceae bacterium]|nr:PQQ-binding-like beta-propeller repeat protein [Polyangiaceae bacterium]